MAPCESVAQEVQVVAGRITDSLLRPLSAVELEIIAGDLYRLARTGANGSYRVVFPNAIPSVVISARRVGYEPRVWRAVDSTASGIIISDAVLRATLLELPPVFTVTRFSTFPTRDRERTITGDRSGLGRTGPVSDPADLNELLSVLPRTIPDSGVSTINGERQTSVLVDGMRVDASLIPPDVISMIRYSAATPDISQGSSAGELSIQTWRGADVWKTSLRGSAAHPSVAWKDPLSAELPFRAAVTSGSLSGPILRGSSHLFLAWSLDERMKNSAHFPSLGDERLAQLGLSSATTSRVVAALNALGAPADGASEQRTSKRTLWLKTDWIPSPTTFLELTLWPTWSVQKSPQGGSTRFPSLGNRVVSSTHTGLLRLTTSLGGWSTDFRGALTLTHASNDPIVAGPLGTVRLPTNFRDGAAGVTTVGFGGADQRSAASGSRWNLKFEQSRMIGLYQSLRIGQELELTERRSVSAADAFGTYTYESIDALEANQPAWFSRQLDTQSNSVRTTKLSIWAGDEWKRSRRFNFSMGGRMDVALPEPTPQLNPQVATAFGLRTNALPREAAYSLRAGFGWVLREGKYHPPLDSRVRGSNRLLLVGGPVPDLDAPGLVPGLRLTGSIGTYRPLVSAATLNQVLAETGLPGSHRTLTCVGPAVAAPDWAQLASGAMQPPDACVDGSPPTFGSTAPRIRVFDSSYRSQTTWRANVGMLIPHKRWSMHADLVLDYSRNRSSVLDVNLRSDPAFTLPSENSRPVFSPLDAIDPITGRAGPAAGRIDPTLGSVQAIRSDLSAWSGQLYLRAGSERAIGVFPLHAEYALRFARSEVRGLGADPRSVASTGGAAPTHSFVITSQGYHFFWFTLGIAYQLSSGRRYAPVVAGDVNGDHRSGDPAFIPDAGALASDPALANEYEALLDRAPSHARRCLTRQTGTVARPHSCTGPWTGRFDLSFDFDPPASFGISPRLRFTTQVFNAGGAIVRLLGLRDTPLAGATASPAIDQTLLHVENFDPVAKRFHYTVNQMFGRAADRGQQQRTFAPFQVQVGVQYSLAGGSRYVPNRLVKSLGLLPEGDAVLSADSAQRILTRWYASNPLERVVALRDTLRLSEAQAQRLNQLREEFDSRLDPIMAVVATDAVRAGRRLDDSALKEQLNTIQPIVADLVRECRDKAIGLLSAEQRLMFESIRRKEIEK